MRFNEVQVGQQFTIVSSVDETVYTRVETRDEGYLWDKHDFANTRATPRTATFARDGEIKKMFLHPDSPLEVRVVVS